MNIFQANTINSFKTRIQKLSPDTQAQWGKMNVYQMLKHCSLNDEMLLRHKPYKRLFIGRIFGKSSLKKNIKDDQPLGKNSPTHPELIIKDNGDVEAQKKAWLAILDQYPAMQENDYLDFVHPFYGKMNSEQVSRWAFKHIDHHLRQFGV